MVKPAFGLRGSNDRTNACMSARTCEVSPLQTTPRYPRPPCILRPHGRRTPPVHAGAPGMFAIGYWQTFATGGRTAGSPTSTVTSERW